MPSGDRARRTRPFRVGDLSSTWAISISKRAWWRRINSGSSPVLVAGLSGGSTALRAAHNSPTESDHSQLQRRLRPMRGLQTDRTAQVVIAGRPWPPLWPASPPRRVPPCGGGRPLSALPSLVAPHRRAAPCGHGRLLADRLNPGRPAWPAVCLFDLTGASGLAWPCRAKPIAEPAGTASRGSTDAVPASETCSVHTDGRQADSARCRQKSSRPSTTPPAPATPSASRRSPAVPGSTDHSSTGTLISGTTPPRPGCRTYDRQPRNRREPRISARRPRQRLRTHGRLHARNRQLEKKLSELLGEAAWNSSALGAPTDTEALKRTVTSLEQQTVEHQRGLAEREQELAAARAANRELMTQLNNPGRRAGPRQAAQRHDLSSSRS
jgi:hypothetical protein